MTQMQTSKLSVWTFVLFVFIIFYSTGAGYVESFVNYPLWYIIGSSPSWATYHQALSAKIIIFLAIPYLLISLILNVMIFFFRPLAIPRWTVWSCLILLLISIFSSAIIQIPIQLQLDIVYKKELVDELIVTDFWLREVVVTLRIPIACYMIYCAIQRDWEHAKK
jgi:hypothetical protein